MYMKNVMYKIIMGCYIVAAHDDFIHYILHIHYYISVS